MANDIIKIGAELTLDNKQIKTEFTKAGEEAGKSVADGLEKQQGNIIDAINETVEEIRAKIETLQEIDWNLVDPNKTEQDIQFLDNELNTLQYTIENLKYGRQDFGDEGKEAFDELQNTTSEYEDALYSAMDQIQSIGEGVGEAMDEAEEQTKETTEAVKELNETANQGISENGGLGKMLKFLSSKEIINFFVKNLKKIGEKLIELSGDSEQLAKKWEPVQDKLEAVGGYIGKGLTPAVSGAIDEISGMADELTKTGEDGNSAISMLQKGVYILGQSFIAIIKVIKNFGQFLGDQISNGRILISAFAKDIYSTFTGLIENLGNADMWSALGNNIKYGIVSGVNDAIGSLNKLLAWIDDKLGIDLGQIGTFDAGQKMSLGFGDFGNTKSALADIKKYNQDAIGDIASERQSFWDEAKQGYKDLANTSINTNRKIKEDTKKTIGGGGGSRDSVKSAYEELEEEAVDVRKEIDSLVEDHQKQYEELTKQIEKIGDEYDKLRDEAKKTWEEAQSALENYNRELEEAQGEAITNLGQRYVELKKDLIGVDEYMKKIASELSWKELDRMQGNGTSEYRGYDLKKIIDLKEKLDEIQLIEENTTEEQRKSDEFIKETSKAQEILNKLKEQELEIEQKKSAELEKQSIAQAIMNQDDGEQYLKTLTKNGEDIGTYYYDAVKKQREKIQDEDNIQYAKQLENKTTSLNDQLKEYQGEKDKEVEILIDTTARKIELENEYQKVFEENIKKQEKELDNLIQKEQKLIDKRREYLSMGGSSHNAYGGSILQGTASIVGENGPEQIVARQSSYVQPRNAVNSYSTINNNSNLSINGLELGNFNTVDEMLNALKERLTYRS